MKITCPQCGAAGNLPDHEIPEEGRFLSCPRCKHGFDVKKPRATVNEYLVDTCPACSYSTFGDERFGSCPKCGIEIKAYIDRQREEKTRAREQELLGRKYSRDTAAPMPVPGAPPLQSPPPPETRSVDIAEMIENLHPVNLIGWGAALVAAVILIMGIFGLFNYFGTDIQAQLTEQREEPVSALYVFLHYGLEPWIKTLYGGSLLAVAVFFLQRQAQARMALGWLSWAAIGYVPVSMTVRFLDWWFQPIPHTWVGYATNTFNILFMSALVGIPLYLLINYLEDRRITSVVKL